MEIDSYEHGVPSWVDLGTPDLDGAVAFYGALGWGLSVWLHAEYWIPIGIIVGAGFGMYLSFARYRIGGPDAPTDSSKTDDAAQKQRPDSNDRGETA